MVSILLYRSYQLLLDIFMEGSCLIREEDVFTLSLQPAKSARVMIGRGVDEEYKVISSLVPLTFNSSVFCYMPFSWASIAF